MEIKVLICAKCGYNTSKDPRPPNEKRTMIYLFGPSNPEAVVCNECRYEGIVNGQEANR